MRTSFYQRLTALILAALMLLPAASCANTGDSSGESSAESTTTAGTSADGSNTGETTASTTETTTDTEAESTSGSETTAGTTDTSTETATDTDTSEPDTGITTSDGSETEDENYRCDLPNDLNYDNAEVNILYIEAPGRADELYSEKIKGNTVSDAVYERNSIVEAQLGVKLVYVPEDDDVPGQSTVKTAITSGDDTLDIFTLGTNWSVSCAIDGCYQNLNEIEYVDLDKHYWSQDYNEMMTFTAEKKQFLATSPAAISLFRLTYLTIYNRDFFADRGLDDLYDVVEAGEWTLEYQKGIVSNVWEDKDGDNLPTEADFYGFVTGTCISIDAYPVTSDITLIIPDEDGYLMFDESKMEKMVEMSEKVSALYTDKGTYCFPQSEQDRIGLNNIMGKFARAEALMATTQFLSLETNIDQLAAMNYGIVPMPKLSVEQKDYRTYVQDQVTSFGISSVITDENRIAMLGAIMEAIAYHSNVKVRPAYYDSTLSLRFMQDPESRAILDTMFETIAFDYCFAIGVGSIRDDLRTRLSTANPGIASRAQAWKRNVNRQLDKDNAALEKLS